MASRKKMHQTTVRFGADLWDALEAECEQVGISIAQYVREAALARLMYAAGESGNRRYATAIAASQEEAAETAAVLAQGRQARRRSRELREEVARQRLARTN